MCRVMKQNSPRLEFNNSIVSTSQDWAENGFVLSLLLYHLNIPRSLYLFIYKIGELSHGENETFSANDYEFAKYIGSNSRTYICNLRKQWKEFQNDAKTDCGVITVKANKYLHSEKRHETTSYRFEIHDLIQKILRTGRESEYYETDWKYAMEKAVLLHREEAELYGKFHVRKPKKLRNADDIFETLLKVVYRYAYKLCDQAIGLGKDVRKVEETAIEVVKKAFADRISEMKSGKNLVDSAYKLTEFYQQLEAAQPSDAFVTFKGQTLRIKNNALTVEEINDLEENNFNTENLEVETNVRSSNADDQQRFSVDNAGERGNNSETRKSNVLEFEGNLLHSKTEESKTDLDLQRNKFFSKYKRE